MVIYLDSDPVIYLIEQVAPYSAMVLARISAGNVDLVSSELARLECLVKPLRAHDQLLVQQYDGFFTGQIANRVPFSDAVFREAAGIRAVYNFQTPDALHLAAAVHSRCDIFLTNDATLTRFTGIAVEVVS